MEAVVKIRVPDGQKGVKIRVPDGQKGVKILIPTEAPPTGFEIDFS